jgi:hypothetical protein
MGWRVSNGPNIHRIVHRYPNKNVVAGMKTNLRQLERVSRIYDDYMQSIQNAIKTRKKRELGLARLRPKYVKPRRTSG